MKPIHILPPNVLRATALFLILFVFALVSCSSAAPVVTAPATTIPPAAAPQVAAQPTTVPATPVPLKALKVSPEQGPVGTAIALSADGLPENKAVEFIWTSVTGSYNMKTMVETIEYYDRKFDQKQTSLGRATTDAQGRLSATLTIPEDYGETHDITATIDGQRVAKGGFAVVRTATISTQQGPVGTPITLEVKGLGYTPFANTIGVLYDNKYTGFMTAVTTQGTARAVIRASGKPGPHEIRLTDASAATPYLNTEQSPRKLPQFKFVFNITEDLGSPKSSVEYPENNPITAVESITRTTVTKAGQDSGSKISVSSGSGPILSTTTLQGKGLPADANVDIYWVSVKGNRVSPSGWNLIQDVVAKGTVGKDGNLAAEVKVPDDLGGWHTLKIAQGEKVLGQVPYFVERSLVGITPAQVKVGETFKFQLKGIGWTELDNGVAVTYDNGYIGYACGFNSQGDITILMQASGDPGTHLIDIYPMIFRGHGEGSWNYNIPHLTALQDQPGLALGYRLPIYRLAIQVVN